MSKPLSPRDPLWEPNWGVLDPFDLSQFPDSATKITRSSAKDTGTGTPAALLQTWIWAHRTSDAAGLLKIWDFPEETSEEQKRERLNETLRDREYARQNPDRIGYAETESLRDMFDLGDGYYLAFIEGKGLTARAWISHQIFRRVGDEWKVSFGRVAK